MKAKLKPDSVLARQLAKLREMKESGRFEWLANRKTLADIVREQKNES